MVFFYLIFGVFFITFMLIVFRGAPYVPTKHRNIQQLFNHYQFKETDILVDLGSGDGRLLREAAKRRVHAVGYELNPILALISWWRLRRYRAFAQVLVRDFWLSGMPEATSVVFVFLASPYMKRLDAHLSRHVKKYKKPLLLVSYGMEIPGKKTTAIDGSLLIYQYKA